MEDPSDNWAGGIIPSYQAHCNYLKRFPAPSIIAYIKGVCERESDQCDSSHCANAIEW